MRTDEDIKSLHPLEVTVLRRYDVGDVLTAAVLQADLGLNVGQSNQALSWLAARDSLQEHNRRVLTRYEITELGRDYAEHGTPEERVQATAREHG
ncbi:MAG: phenylalanine--tRNA ligase subunit alpha, partial [Spirochaeta sp.]|nr:phenylalanine--tRNA ligase subunit alpha [Spirochaeta sp.]